MFAEVLINENVSLIYPTFTYTIPQIPTTLNQETIPWKTGTIVSVPFGRRQTTGIILNLLELQQSSIADKKIKQITQIIPDAPHLSEKQIEIAKWISSYYSCPLYKTITLFLPKALWKGQTQTKKEELIAIKDNNIALDFITNRSAKYKKQIDLLKFLLNNRETHRNELVKEQKFSSQQINTLIAKGILERKHGRIATRTTKYIPFSSEVSVHKKLSPDQKQAIEKIISNRSKPTLLHGITGSGKTEIFLQLCKKLLTKNKQAGLLVPEISLTPQLIGYFNHDFKGHLSAWHSRLTEKEKQQEFARIGSGEAKIVIGSRSALFLPFRKLELLIIDEEHDTSYKQSQTPKYHTHEIALKIKQITGTILIFSSATPKIETYHRALSDEFQLIELKDRIYSDHTNKRQTKSELPPVQIVDLRDEFKKKNFSIFSENLQEALKKTIHEKKQAILFLNRRGTATSTVCRECGYTVFCPNCDVPLTTHINNYSNENNFLLCHHCNYFSRPPDLCPKCKSIHIKYLGIGTEKIEQELKKLLPEAKILRADKDTTANKYSFQQVYHQMKSHTADILIGTQMITKGLDLENISLVAAILADIGLNIPDFRSSERIFQLLTQVAGRTGRREEHGQVIIQTYSPEHYSIQAAARHDYKKFYNQEIAFRRQLGNPPFNKLIKLTFSDSSREKAKTESKNMADLLERKNNHENIIHLAPALIFKLKNKYRYNILIKGPDPQKLIQRVSIKNPWSIDVDPEFCI